MLAAFAELAYRRPMTIREKAALVLVTCALGAAPADLGAWGPVGHRVVTRIALTEMSPAARRLVADLLGTEDPLEASIWADRIRVERPETYNWHFVDIPWGAASYVPSRDCRPTARGDCVIAAIGRTWPVLSDRSRVQNEGAEALKFVMHFVADVHQPLHAIDNRDRGGNDVATIVEGYAPPDGRSQPNLHAVWDSVLIDSRGLGVNAYAAALVARLPSDPVPDGNLDPAAWAVEAHALAEQYAYRYPGFSRGGPPPAPVTLDTAYQRVSLVIVERQLLRAGVRLARILDAAARLRAPALGSR
jgi:hypothetical protein